MSLLPRRTNEFATGSTMKQERLSRIAQPIRRDRSLKRSSSTDQVILSGNTNTNTNNNQQTNSLITPMRIKNKRSVSATPMRTPNRQIRPPIDAKTLLLTAEKERYPDDKKLIQEKANRIAEYADKYIFKSTEPILSHGNGLKTMSIKQFIIIVNYLLKYAGGNRLVVNAGNYIEQIVKILTKLGYPYNINKSWLKSPTASYAYGYIVILIEWLLAFAPNHLLTDNNKNDANDNDDGRGFDYKYIKPNENLLPDKDYTRIFLDKESEAFFLWNNNKDDEYENLKKSMIDELIRRKYNFNGIKELNEEIEKIQLEINDICKNRKIIKNETIFMKTEKEVEEKQKLKEELEMDCFDKKKQLSTLEKQLNSTMETINSLKDENHKLKEMIKTQKMSANQKAELLQEIDYLEDQLNIKKKSVLELQELGSRNQITYARLIKNLSETVAKFNSFINRIFSGLENLETININDMILNQNSDNNETIDEQLKRIIPKLNEIKMNNFTETNLYEEQIQNIKTQLKYYKYEYDEILKDKYSIINGKLIEYDMKIEKYETQYLQKIIQIEKSIEMNKYEIELLKKDNDKLKILIEQRKNDLEKYKNENKLILEEISDKANEMLLEKEKRIYKFEKTVNEFTKVVDKLEKVIRDQEYNNNLLSENNDDDNNN